MHLSTDTIIRALTAASLAGLLLAVGLRLRAGQIIESLRQCRFGLILIANFVVVPALALVLTKLFRVGAECSVGMLLLAAAPFAPVVPVFARMARADLALAAGLTSFFPLLSAFLTPLVCALTLRAVPNAGDLRFNVATVLLTLLATITLPLGLGVAVNHLAPALARRVLRPVEIASEATGAISLAFVTITEFGLIVQTGWVPLLAMLLSFELSLGLGYALGGQTVGARRVVALGTSNRNIALGLLVALGSFAGTPVVPALVANGLLLILLGLVHVACWRFVQDRNRPQPG